MIVGHLDDLATYEAVLKKVPALAQALEWANAQGRSKEPGKYPIEGEMFGDVQLAKTQPREEGRFEAHREFIDVQFCYEGGEIIEWAPTSTLEPINEYTPDVQNFSTPGQLLTALHLTLNTFAIFFPGDAHMPKVSDGEHSQVRKVVVKVPVSSI